MEIKITKTTNPKTKPTENLGFGKYFSDHMFIMDYEKGKGWHDARIVPFADISMSPAATVFHYGAEVFEGLKAYRCADGSVQLFRPIENATRMNNSADRIRLPQIPVDDTIQAIKQLVEIDKDWVPSGAGESLYIRPFLFGSDAQLGLHEIKQARFMIICSPSGSYYAEGINPVKIMIEDEDVRAVRGGTGYAKCGGNYAASNRAGEKAEKLGFTQVLWLDGVERKYIEEVGAMNVMMKINGEVVTPMLTGSILPGVTRKSIIELLKSKGYKVTERRISVEEIINALESGELEEFWGCGTAAVVSPVGELYYEGKTYVINDNKIGETTQMLYDTLTGIQWGRIKDEFGWTVNLGK
ncbi:MAG: branched-chain amino acid aminotransferase [Firmicutes bacterium]|nr:branched-chain amino acid aminotransferase [Bacillota bacterium]